MFADNVAHNLCCQVRADDNSSTCNNDIVLACFNCTSHIINFGYVELYIDVKTLTTV